MTSMIETAGKLRNPGPTHIFLGHPLSDGCDKTVVEPGNIFSPGVGTVGLYPLLENRETVCNPAAPDSGTEWKFVKHPSFLPVIEARYKADTVSVTHFFLTEAEEVQTALI